MSGNKRKSKMANFPPKPEHLKGVEEWNELIARAWAWKEWCQMERRDMPELAGPTVEAAVDYIFDRWRKKNSLEEIFN